MTPTPRASAQPDAVTRRLTLKATDAGDLSHGIRRLAVFKSTVEGSLGQFNRRYGHALRLDERVLTRSFLHWTRAFDAQRVLADADREDFSYFAAGLLLQTFLAFAPVSEGPASGTAVVPAGLPEAQIVAFWPAGFYYFEFCITVLDTVLRQAEIGGVDVAPAALELRSWQSFRENVSENPGLAVAFLDHFLGRAPNWDFPTVARFRDAIRRRLVTDPARRLPAP